jgi:hypothetical protein
MLTPESFDCAANAPTCESPRLYLLFSYESRGTFGDTVNVNVRDIRSLLLAPLRCLGYRVLREKHNSAQREASAHSSSILCVAMCAQVFHLYESRIHVA